MMHITLVFKKESQTNQLTMLILESISNKKSQIGVSYQANSFLTQLNRFWIICFILILIVVFSPLFSTLLQIRYLCKDRCVGYCGIVYMRGGVIVIQLGAWTSPSPCQSTELWDVIDRQGMYRHYRGLFISKYLVRLVVHGSGAGVETIL